MKLSHGLHLAYCTNVHRGESWPETLHALDHHVLPLRQRVCPGKPFAIGLRLGDAASRDLSDPAALLAFQRWLDRNQCYIFTINGFPFGAFHGTRVKERVYAPDWTDPARLEYTMRLFDLLGRLVPEGVQGSVSTVPVSFKEFLQGERAERRARENLWRCVEHIERVSRQTGRTLHLGLEPEPLCVLETTAETAAFFERMRADRPGDLRLDEHLGVTYDTCHLAVEFESPAEAIGRLRQHGIRISKLHLSSALSARPVPEVRAALAAFADPVYLHQVVSRSPDGALRRFKDLDEALADPGTGGPEPAPEWRVHFHVPLHSGPTPLFGRTTDHLLGVLSILQQNPGLCSHLEMETYTWEVLPPELKNRSVTEQIAAEYAWTLRELAARQFTPV